MDARLLSLKNLIFLRQHLARLKTEIADIGSTLPQGTYISIYKSNSKSNAKHYYYYLGHKKKFLTSPIPGKAATYKFHLGKPSNPRYLEGILAIEAMQMKQVKTATLDRIRDLYKRLRRDHLQSNWSIFLDEQDDQRPSVAVFISQILDQYL